MGNIYVNECAETESQNWFVMEDGRIALVPSDQSKCQRPHPWAPGTHGLTRKPRAMRRPGVHEGDREQSGWAIQLCWAGEHWGGRQGDQLAVGQRHCLSTFVVVSTSQIDVGVACFRKNLNFEVSIMTQGSQKRP
jgi:hypothetical protein